MTRATTRFLRRCRVRHVLGAMSIVLLTGCIVIPVDFYSFGSRHNLTEQTGAGLHPGRTTKEEVLLLLGEPDYVSEDGQCYGYAWKKTRLIMTGIGGGGGFVERRYLLQVSFDATDYVSDVGVAKEWTTNP
jgi:hypothetical protein